MLSIHIKHDSANTSRYIYTEPHHSFMLQITFTVIPENHKLLINSTTDEFIFVYFIQLQIAYNCRSPCRGTFQSGGGRGTVCDLLKNCQALLHAESLASICPWEQFLTVLNLILVSGYLWWKAVCSRYCTYCTCLRKKIQNYHWGGTL